VTAKGGEFRGSEEEGSEEGEEKEVISVRSTLGAAPPSGTHITHTYDRSSRAE
jgi:hypothetical protein